MKKLMCVVVLMLGMSMATFASNDSVDNTKTLVNNYSFNVNANSLARFLVLTEDQEDLVIKSQRTFEKSLASAFESESKSSRDAIVENAITKNLREMHALLTEKQYAKYLTVLNLSLKHRHIID